jgi:hypothetical protein
MGGKMTHTETACTLPVFSIIQFAHFVVIWAKLGSDLLDEMLEGALHAAAKNKS